METMFNVTYKTLINGRATWVNDYLLGKDRAEIITQLNPAQMLTAPLIRKAVHGEWDCNGWTNGGEHKCK